jgi:hypothetical protein
VRAQGSEQAHGALTAGTDGGDAEAAGAGFVGDVEVGAGMGFADLGQDLLQGMEIVGDGAVEADLALGAGFGQGEGEGLEPRGTGRKEFD